MNAAGLLRATRKEIEAPECWTKEESARDSTGGACSPTHPAASCFCLAGALGRAAVVASLRQDPPDTFALPIAKDALTESVRAEPDWRPRLTSRDGLIDAPYVHFNDHPATTHADVLALIDRAIERLED